MRTAMFRDETEVRSQSHDFPSFNIGAKCFVTKPKYEVNHMTSPVLNTGAKCFVTKAKYEVNHMTSLVLIQVRNAS